MRPTPQELIDNVCAVLRDAIADGRAPGEARHKVRQALAVLRDGAWDEAGFAVLRESAALADLLGRYVPNGTDTEAPAPASFAAANARNRSLRAALADAIDRMRAEKNPGAASICADIAKTLAAARAKV